MKAKIVDGKRDRLVCIVIVWPPFVKGKRTVETACTDPNHMAISSCTTRCGVQGAFFGDVSMIH